MTGAQARRLTTLGRVLGFAELHPLDFAAGGKAAGLLELVRLAHADATAGGTGQSTGGGRMRAGTATKAELYEDLYEDLQAINRTAKALATELPGLEEKFRMPRVDSYATTLISARAFLQDARPLELKFLEYELPADFLAELEAKIAAFGVAQDDQGKGITQQVGATRLIAEALLAGILTVRKLDPLMRNKYRSQPAKLAEWFTASHVERPARGEEELKAGGGTPVV